MIVQADNSNQNMRVIAEDVTLSSVPDNVDPDLGVDFDYLNPPGLECGDVYRALS